MTENQPFGLLQTLIEESHTFHLQEQVKPIREALLDKEENSSKEIIDLPEICMTGLPLQEILNTRTANRFFDHAPIDLRDAGTVLAAAVTGDQADWDEQRQQGVKLNILMIAWRVNELECPAVYRYEDKKHALIKVGPAPAQEEGEVLVLQREFSWAPAILIVTGSMGAALDYYGSHGYRHMLVRGGEAGYRAWLAAMSLGYTGSVFAGLLPRPLREVAQVDGYKEAQLFAFCFGRPLQIPT